MNWLQRKMTRHTIMPIRVDVYFTTSKETFADVRATLKGEPRASLDGLGGIVETLANNDSHATLILCGVFEHDLGCFAHEMAHVVFHAMDIVGQNGDYGQAAQQENFCYHLDNLVDVLHPVFTKAFKGAKK